MNDREKWDGRWLSRAGSAEPPDPFVVGVAPLLPPKGRALDLAGGPGRHARVLAERGLDVTVCDISLVALAFARAAGLAAVERDLEREPLPPGPWDVILVFHFLERRLFPDFAPALAPGGWLIYVHPTRRNLERHAHPSERFLAAEGELRGAAAGLDVVSYDEGWNETGRHEARLVAQRP